MDNYQPSQQIKRQIEALIIEAIRSVLKELTQQISEVRKNSEMKF
jgi:hypothetical protein